MQFFSTWILLVYARDHFKDVVCFLQNNITEIRTDALKLLAMLRRPFPRPNATIGAWLNIFQVNYFPLLSPPTAEAS